MASEEVVLDEIQWRAPPIVQELGGIHENTVLYYFAESPFFDQTSNNASLRTQAIYNPSMAYIMETRQAFEDGLRKMQGLEFMVASSARDFGRDPAIGEGQWVIRKQQRRKRADGHDEITVLGTYFVIGENIYMAPSVNNVIGSKLLSTTSSMSKFLDVAWSLPQFTPALGHRYFPPPARTSETPSTSQVSQQSREATPVPGSQSQSGAARPSSVTSSAASSSTVADTQALYESFNQFVRYGSEYMDENPLVGEPGSFVFSSSKHHLQSQQQAAQKAKAGKVQIVAQQLQDATPQPSRPSTPQSKVDTAPLGKKNNKEGTKAVSGAPLKPKRRKSRVATSPSTPVPALSPS